MDTVPSEPPEAPPALKAPSSAAPEEPPAPQAIYVRLRGPVYLRWLLRNLWVPQYLFLWRQVFRRLYFLSRSRLTQLLFVLRFSWTLISHQGPSPLWPLRHTSFYRNFRRACNGHDRTVCPIGANAAQRTRCMVRLAEFGAIRLGLEEVIHEIPALGEVFLPLVSDRNNTMHSCELLNRVGGSLRAC